MNTSALSLALALALSACVSPPPPPTVLPTYAPLTNCLVEWPDDPDAPPELVCPDGTRRVIEPGKPLRLGNAHLLAL